MAGLTLTRLSAVAIATWLVLLLYISLRVSSPRPPSQPDSPQRDADPAAAALQRIHKAGQDLQELKRQNQQLRALLSQPEARVTKGLPLLRSSGRLGHESPEHEELRRRVFRGIWELWYSVRGEVKRMRPEADKTTQAKLSGFLASLQEQWTSLAADVGGLGAVDGAEEWRQRQLANLTKQVQGRIARLQNPRDCEAAPKMVCQLNKGCGFGCQIHHAAYCAIVAYASGRTLILDTKGWRYSAKGWDSVFLPVAPPCAGVDTSGAVQWKGPDAHAADPVVSLPIIDSLRPSPEVLPLSFPAELADQLIQLHGNPPVWWIGQFVTYLMRFAPELEVELAEQEKAIKFRRPIVGLHVRRTDKLGAEAQFHALSEYMEWAALWWDVREQRHGPVIGKRRVFLATDDKGLLSQARKEFPDWDILGSADVAASAQLNSRYSDSSLHGVIQDIHFLSLADHLVCTFSSQVCRVAYELMQVRRGDAALAYDSLDDLFYFGGQHGHEVTAFLPHQPTAEDQIALQPGDVVGIAGNHWNGWSKGRNMRTGELGLFPSYKVREKWRIVPFHSAQDAAASSKAPS